MSTPHHQNHLHCAVCGRFVSTDDILNGHATHHMTQPDCAFGPEEWETPCARHQQPTEMTAPNHGARATRDAGDALTRGDLEDVVEKFMAGWNSAWKPEGTPLEILSRFADFYQAQKANIAWYQSQLAAAPPAAVALGSGGLDWYQAGDVRCCFRCAEGFIVPSAIVTLETRKTAENPIVESSCPVCEGSGEVGFPGQACPVCGLC